MRFKTLTDTVAAGFLVFGLTSVAHAASAPTVNLACHFRTPKPDVVGTAFLDLDFARWQADSTFRLASVATLGDELNFKIVDSFKKVENQIELNLRSQANPPYVVDGTISLRFAESDMNKMISGLVPTVPVTVVQTSGKTGVVTSPKPCDLSQRRMFTKDASEDATVDAFVKNVRIENTSSVDYPIWKRLETPNLKIFCVISLAQRSNGINWPTREYCSFEFTVLGVSDGGNTLFRHLVGQEAELIYNTLPGHQVKFIGDTHMKPTDPDRISETSIVCDSPKHCLITAKFGPVRK